MAQADFLMYMYPGLCLQAGLTPIPGQNLWQSGLNIIGLPPVKTNRKAYVIISSRNNGVR